MKKRNEINDEYKWDLSSLYESLDSFESDFEIVKTKSDQLIEYKGKILKTATNLLEVIELSLQVSRILSNLYAFAKMRSDEDTGDTENQGLVSRVESLSVTISSKTSFITPEILSGSKEKIESYIDDNIALKEYRQHLDDILRMKPHVLSEKEEKIIAQAGEVMAGSENIFSMLNNADFKFPTIKDENGEDLQLSHGNFIKTLEKPHREVRAEAFKKYYSVYENHKNAIATTLATQIKKDVFIAKTRNYDSALEASLNNNKIPTTVYDRLIESVHENIDGLHDYIALRKKALGLDELHMYDLYTPIIKSVDFEIPYNESKDMLLKSLKPLGEEYVSVVNDAFNKKWIDVYESQGKRSGAYSYGTYDSLPYILLNYQDNLNSLFTLTHEMGHSMHSYLTRNKQPFVYGDYSIFLAEIASTTNEAFLTDYLLENLEDEQKKLYVLNHYLEQFRGTIFRQVMFAEFEKFMHEKVEKGEPLTVDVLNKKYKELNEFYYGPSVVVDDEIALEWARIPHFYYNFYVFQYATGFSAAIAMNKKIKEEGPSAVKDYIEFLSGGSSKYPIDLLKQAGIDMTSKAPVEDALKVFKSKVKEMEMML
jgi:oligoendopeptidase F